MFQMECPAGCGEVLESEVRSEVLVSYDRHIAKRHRSSPAQWTEGHNKIEAGKEMAKKAGSARSAGKS